jgi:FkbM family methyltransferase
MIKEEIEFYKKVKDKCDIIFDVGCREDIDYIVLNPDKEFHYFEPNVEFFNNCKAKLSSYQNSKIHLNNFGLGKETGNKEYWPDSQSFMYRLALCGSPDKHFTLKMKKFSEYLSENNIEKIDFLKIDTEGYEPDIIFDDPIFILDNVKYLQFEYGSTWTDRFIDTNLKDMWEFFKDFFDFYFLTEEEHPLSKDYKELIVPIEGDALISNIHHLSVIGFGANIIMIKKGFYAPV